MVTNSRNHLIFPAPMAVPVQGQLWRRKEEDKVRTYGCASGWKWSRKSPSHGKWQTLRTQIKYMQRNSKAKTQRNHACKQPKPSHVSCSNSSSCPRTAMAKKGGRQSYNFATSESWIHLHLFDLRMIEIFHNNCALPVKPSFGWSVCPGLIVPIPVCFALRFLRMSVKYSRITEGNHGQSETH